ncbi:MAG: DNA primase catalytic subunit PriS [Candidatus Marsarchaeota archaeon]|nr:DNA primase catalytic subunit PriS [Candidatus Marsarchaeota archaeon]
MADEDGIRFVKRLLADYYRKQVGIGPERLDQREFGVGDFERKIAFRHLAFRSSDELRRYLAAEAPPYVSYSCSYYKDPAGRPMERKGWLGTELVFDLDATDMELGCQKLHGRSWVCANCLEEVKAETVKLVENFLVPDFGFSGRDMMINFSGNRGYHVHVNDKSVLALDSAARKEITDYISGRGVEMGEFFPTLGMRGKMLRGPRHADRGWGGKMARQFLADMNNGIGALMALGIDKPTARMIYRKRALIELGINNGNWDMVYIKDKAEFWKRILENQRVKQSDRIDKNVTTDISHLIRLPNSIHGSTGLVAKAVGSVADLAKFDPMRDAIAFKGEEMRIKADTGFPLLMNGRSFGPYGGEIKVPVYVALYLYLKGHARLLGLA